jgi:hypothetical protein
MNAKSNHIKPMFAPETEFQVQALTILLEGQSTESLDLTEMLDLPSDKEFGPWPTSSFSALND